MAYKKLKYWFDEALARDLASKISQVKPDFPARAFVREVKRGLEDKELKPRVAWMADQLAVHLPGDFPSNLPVILGILGPENERETGMFTDFYWLMPVAKYVEDHGLDHFPEAMTAIAEITKRNTGEYAIRPYLERYPDRTLATMRDWAKAGNFHLRRLASEGGRPRLPWAGKLQRFIDEPRPLLPILEQLRDDPVRYVQKSVANCLNDISKDHPELLRDVIAEWRQDPTPARAWIMRHGLRHLARTGAPWV